MNVELETGDLIGRGRKTVNLPAHLDLIAASPDGIQKLRGLILELAVRGKLVPQDPQDEPASELLRRIAQERARLEAAGHCKKSKVKPLSSDEKWPSELPSIWEWTNLATVALINPRNAADDSTEAEKPVTAPEAVKKKVEKKNHRLSIVSKTRTPVDGFESVEMFSAMSSGDIDVLFKAKDATAANIMVTNNSDRPLAIEMPATRLRQSAGR